MNANVEMGLRGAHRACFTGIRMFLDIMFRCLQEFLRVFVKWFLGGDWAWLNELFNYLRSQSAGKVRPPDLVEISTHLIHNAKITHAIRAGTHRRMIPFQRNKMAPVLEICQMAPQNQHYCIHHPIPCHMSLIPHIHSLFTLRKPHFSVNEEWVFLRVKRL